MKEINVLYIDDEEINLEVFLSSFRKIFRIFLAQSAEEGLKILNRENIHVVIADQRMPEKSGNAFFEEIKEHYPDIVRIILTAYADYETAYDSINRGYVFRFLQKPWDFYELVKTIEDGYRLYTLTKSNKQLLEEYQFLFQSHNLPILIIDRDTHFIAELNEAASVYFNLDKDFRAQNINNFLSLNKVFSQENKLHYIRNGNNELRQAFVRLKQVKWKDLPAYLLTIEDQTELLQFEKAKLNYVSEVQAYERKKLSMELHDGIAQELTLLKLFVESGMNEDSEEYQGFMTSYRQIVGSIRELSYNLNPPDLKEGFSTALEKLFNRLNKASEVNFTFINEAIDRMDPFLSKNRSYHLYRITQEFINNALKYSGASEIKCEIRAEQSHVVMELSDNGEGFEVELATKGDGLKNMAERSRIVGMEFSLVSAPGAGTKLALSGYL
ncbi:MAG: response regulator [Brumimicrobium sp.]|nr:response regulator [Brumimicrobium sp.]